MPINWIRCDGKNLPVLWTMWLILYPVKTLSPWVLGKCLLPPILCNNMLLVNIVANGELYLLGGSPSLWAVDSLLLSASFAINKNQEFISQKGYHQVRKRMVSCVVKVRKKSLYDTSTLNDIVALFSVQNKSPASFPLCSNIYINLSLFHLVSFSCIVQENKFILLSFHCLRSI